METNINSAIGITDILIDAISKKYDNIRDLNSLNVNLEEENYEAMVPVIDSIIEDENNSIGKLQQLIDLLSGSEEDIEEGKQDTIELIDNSDEFMESITSMKKKLKLSENFDNVIDDVQAVASPTFVGANKEHDENKKKYEDAMEENKKAAEDTIPDEGETGKKVKSKNLKAMHLSEHLFEDITSSIKEEVENFLIEYLGEKFADNIAMVVSSNVPDYDPSWCAAAVGDFNTLESRLVKAQMSYIRALVNMLFAEKDSLTEDLSFDNYDDFNHEVYNAISDVCFNFKDKNLSKKDIEAAIEWFETHYFEDEDFELDIEEENIEESFNKKNLKEDFNKKLWVDWYGLFNVIVDKYFPDEDLISDKVDALYKLFEFEPGMQEAYKRWNTNPIDESLNESFVAEWWGQVDGDTPQTVAKAYNLSVKPIKRKQDEVLYKFEGNLKDFSKALDDGYFYSLIVQQDAGHSKDVDSLLYESIQSKIAKEQIKRFTEGKMPKNWNVNSYLKKLVESKHITKKEAKSLNEWYSKNK